MKKRISSIAVMIMGIVAMVASGTALAHSHYGNSNETLTPSQVAPGDTVTVAFNYRVWHSHGCRTHYDGWRIYLDGTLMASGRNSHPACNNTITHSVSQDITVPADLPTGYHTVAIVTSVDNNNWYRSYTRRTELMLDVMRIDANVNIDPDVLKMTSKGKWVTAYIGLPDGYNINDIDISSVKLEDVIPAVRGEVQGDVLMVKFNRSELQNMITSMGGEQNDVELSVSGDVGTMKFEGFDIMGVNY